MALQKLSVCLQMPALQELKTPEYLRHLQQQDTDQSLWEVGASCNFLIATARLGMCCSAVANLGDDVYGDYLLKILEVPSSYSFEEEICAGRVTCLSMLTLTRGVLSRVIYKQHHSGDSQ